MLYIHTCVFRTSDLLSRGSDSTEVRGGRDNGARSVVSGRVPNPTPPECAHCTTVRAWLPQCCGSHRGPQAGAADLPKAGVPGRCACFFEAVPRVVCSAGKRWNLSEGSKSRSALGPRRSRCRRGPRLRRIPPAAQHSRIAKVDEHFCVFTCVQPIWGRCGDAHDCSCGLQLKVIESMKEKRRLLPA